MGMLGAVRPRGAVRAVGVSGVLPLHRRVHTSLSVGMFADSDGKFSARDAQLGLPLYVVDEPSVQWVVTPGVSLPLGSSTAGLEYTLLTTGSFDPTLSTAVSAGSTWLVFAGASVRAPLHPGFDRVQQGVFTTASVSGARRIGSGGLAVGISTAHQTRRGFSSPGFFELAPTASWSVPLGKRWGLNVGARVPVYTRPSPPPYWFAVQITVNHVVKLKKD